MNKLYYANPEDGRRGIFTEAGVEREEEYNLYQGLSRSFRGKLFYSWFQHTKEPQKKKQ